MPKNMEYVAINTLGEMLGMTQYKARLFMLMNKDFPSPILISKRFYWDKYEVKKYIEKNMVGAVKKQG